MKRKRTKKDSKSKDEKPRKRRKANKAKKTIESMNLKELKKTLIDLTYNHPELQEEVVGMTPKTDIGKAIERFLANSRKASRASSGRYSSNNHWSLGKARGFLSAFSKELSGTLIKMQKKKEFSEMKDYLGRISEAIELYPTEFSIRGGNEVSLQKDLEDNVKKGYLRLLKIKKLGFENLQFEGIIEDIEDTTYEIKKICEEKIKSN